MRRQLYEKNKILITAVLGSAVLSVFKVLKAKAGGSISEADTSASSAGSNAHSQVNEEASGDEKQKILNNISDLKRQLKYMEDLMKRLE